MIYEKCKEVIEAGFENQSYMTKDLMILQVEMFNVAGKFTELGQYDELISLLNPPIEEIVE